MRVLSPLLLRDIGIRRRSEVSNLAAVNLRQYFPPLRVLVLHVAAEHDSAIFQLDDLRRDFRLQGLANFLKRLDVNLRFGS